MLSCFCIGHRSFKEADHDDAFGSVSMMISILAESDYTDFYISANRGWDLFCASVILTMKNDYPQIRLHLVLPFAPDIQEKCISDNEINIRNYVLKNADDIKILSEEQDKDAIKKCGIYLISLGDIGICFLDKRMSKSNTAQIFRAARKAKKIMLNLYYDG